MPKSVTKVEIVEVGPRDGLQNESQPFSTEAKLSLINRLIEAGIRRLEVASFVHPKLVPQMADAEAVVAGLSPSDDVIYIGLVLNDRGLDRALATRASGAGIDQIGCVAVASDEFGRANQGQTRSESIEVTKAILKRARAEGIAAQVTLSASFGCPFEGDIPMDRVVAMAAELAEAEPIEIALADTIGAAVPVQVAELFTRVREALPDMPLRGHFHNTRNTAVANAWAALGAGAATLDASIGGLGGCPFAPKATGNVATEDLVYLFERSGFETGVSLPALLDAVNWLQGELGRPTPGMVGRAGGFPPAN